ncbi:hypothetical protein ILUMI_07925 [Ignelater luminosus]|uniref:Uncharacterized protein n=1 Tax=Ignelater luminosus TaxID=2038154 RepID=A0A8K0D740_IGNLU|nr:hypothetical protein ILUMI_07925 [Ignelater luminosus]
MGVGCQSKEDAAIAARESSIKTITINEEAHYESYNKILEEWLQKGIIEEVLLEDAKNGLHYLTHKPIIKESSATAKKHVEQGRLCEKAGLRNL